MKIDSNKKFASRIGEQILTARRTLRNSSIQGHFLLQRNSAGNDEFIILELVNLQKDSLLARFSPHSLGSDVLDGDDDSPKSFPLKIRDRVKRPAKPGYFG